MKKTILATTAACMFAGSALAADPTMIDAQYVDAPVLHVAPQYATSEVRTPVQSCSQQLVPVGAPSSYVPNVIGGVAGGLLGNTVGKGSGNKAATVAGAIIGTIVGGNLSQPSGTRYENRTVCTTTYQISHNQRPNGYLVTYEFQGRQYTTRTYYRPAGTIRLRVSTSHTVN
tara:strand:+ start:3559 stop:4074 length:516 start_codon:yes stop_codon:yes gene_type:complete